jgi:glucose/arabinose dehydrogenase
MMGVAVDPNFAQNRRIYVYSTSSLTAPGGNRVMRLTVNADFTNVADRTDIVDDIVYKPKASDHPFGGPGAHNGGRVRFNPVDGFLYVTTGDTHNGVVPQSPTMLGGKVLRIDRDGKAAPGNNPPAGFDPRIYTYGHRNVQGLARDRVSGALFAHEHGPRGGDEVNALAPGRNYGWPVITYGVDYSGAEITPFRAREGMEQPLDTWTPSIAPSGMIVYRGGAFPQFEGDLLVTGLVSSSLWHLDVQDGRVVGRRELLADRGQRLRHVVEGPAGELYVLTDSDAGAILKLTPQG